MTTWVDLVLAANATDRLVVLSHEESWTGNELLSKAAGAADWMDELGLRSRPPIPALVGANRTALALLIGAAGSGRALAPLGTRLIPSEIATCVEAMGSGILLAEPDSLPLAAEVAELIDVIVQEVSEPPLSDRKLAGTQGPDDPALVVHTSGTTGAPKAVPYRDAALVKRVRLNASLMGFDENSRYVTTSPFHHIGGVGNLVVALSAGAAVIEFPRFSVDNWLALEPFEVTHALLVPSMVEMLFQADSLHPGKIQLVQYGGAPIHPDTLAKLVEVLPDAGQINMFGQTEGSPISCLTPADHRAAMKRPELLKSVGRAAPGIELRLDDVDEATGIGEIWARGEHLFVGDEEGWLHTGDLARIDDDGYVFLSGRRGDKIIRGGENIFPQEVENVLRTHPAVIDACVIGLPDRRLGESVKAFLVLEEPDNRPEDEELRLFTRERLAGFKVPAAWGFREELPRNPAGKLLRRKLVEEEIAMAADPSALGQTGS